MEHKIKFEVNRWEDCVEKIIKKMNEGYILDKIDSVLIEDYYDNDFYYRPKCYIVKMIKYEKENDND